MRQLAVNVLKQWLRFVVTLMLAATGAWIVMSLPAAPVLASPAAVPTPGFDHASGVGSTYDYRPDFARPPPGEVAAYGYDTPAELADPAADGGRVRRAFSDSDDGFVAPSSGAGQRIFRAVEPDELADLAGSGAFRNAPGLEGKYFWPTRGQADDFAALATKANMGGPYCTVSGCIPANVLRQIEAIPMDGLGPAYYIPEKYLSLIDDVIIHGG